MNIKFTGREPTPEMLKVAQTETELGAYVCANWAGAYDCISELWRAMWDKAAASPPAGAEVVARVRPLVWTEEVKGVWWIADAYRIEVFDGGGFAARVSQPQSRAFRTIAYGVSFEKAKAAAQADYERRILSALEPTPSTDAVRRQAREALAPFARLEVPTRPQGNAGAYSILHKDILAARAAIHALAEMPPPTGET